MASRGISLTYGGSSCGLMGAVADAVLAAGGHVTGVIPQSLADKEIAHQHLSELIVVDSMHQRKQVMADHSDAFIALPGGFGTLDESFEAITWTQLGIHGKPFGFLNIDHYFDALITFMRHQSATGFVRREHLDMLLCDADPESLIRQMNDVALPTMGKWLSSDTGC